MKKHVKSSDRCKICLSLLSAQNIPIGLCTECAAKEIKKLKNRIWLSTIFGAIFAIIFLTAVRYARTTYFVSDMAGYEGDVFLPFFYGHFAFNARAFDKILNLSIPAQLLIAAICFFIPFSSYVSFGANTYRHKAELDIYKLEPISGNYISGFGSHRMEDVGLFMVSILLSIVSGPFFYIYKLYKLRQLSHYVKGTGN